MKKLIIMSFMILSTGIIFSQTARVQVIHNSADAIASEVDVYLDTTLAIDDFSFRTATGFLDLPAGVQIELSVAPGNSTSVNDAVYTAPVTLMANETYIVVADGIVSPTGYNPAPPFGLQIYAMGREGASNASNTDVLVHHGSTDAPTVDVLETGVGAGTIVDDLAYSDFQGYLELPTDDYVIEIRDETGTVGVAAYQAPLATLNLDGVALVVVASGFLDPSQNSNGEDFGLFVALPSGGALVELPSAPLGVNDNVINEFALYPNPASSQLNFEYSGVTLNDLNLRIMDNLGRIISRHEIDAQNKVMDISSMVDGAYLLLIMEGDSVLDVKKFMKN